MGMANMPYKFVSGKVRKVIKSPREKILAKRPVWIVPRIRRLRTVSVRRIPVLDRAKMVVRTTILCVIRRSNHRSRQSMPHCVTKWYGRPTCNHYISGHLHGKPGDDRIIDLWQVGKSKNALWMSVGVCQERKGAYMEITIASAPTTIPTTKAGIEIVKIIP